MPAAVGMPRAAAELGNAETGSSYGAPSMTHGEAQLHQAGEITAAQMSWTWIKDGVPIPAGTKLGQCKLSSAAAREYEELALILADLSFARDCFAEAEKIGAPNVSQTQSRALIHSGTI